MTKDQQSKSLAGRRVLVTGSGTGIGREIALKLACQGAEVVLHYAHDASGAQSAAAAATAWLGPSRRPTQPRLEPLDGAFSLRAFRASRSSSSSTSSSAMWAESPVNGT